jgi:hypothetical protein
VSYDRTKKKQPDEMLLCRLFGALEHVVDGIMVVLMLLSPGLWHYLSNILKEVTWIQ